MRDRILSQAKREGRRIARRVETPTTECVTVRHGETPLPTFVHGAAVSLVPVFDLSHGKRAEMVEPFDRGAVERVLSVFPPSFHHSGELATGDLAILPIVLSH